MKAAAASRALAFVYAISQSQVTANADGTIEVSALKNAAGYPFRWREVAPLRYRQVGGDAYVVFGTDDNGNVVSWATDYYNMVSVEQRVTGLRTFGSIKVLFSIAAVIIVLSLLIRLGGWIARRNLKLALPLSRNEQIVHAIARIGAIAFLIVLAGWPMLLGSETAILSPSLPATMMLLYVVGVVAVIGLLAMIAEAVMRVMRGPGGWLVRSGEILVGLAAVYAIWFIFAMQFVNFVTNF